MTVVRIVEPTSPFCSRYVVRFDPTARQWLPPVSQRFHSYENEVGSPFHEPFVVLSTLSTFRVPETTGAAVFSGAAPFAIRPVGPDTALAEPSELVAVTATRSRRPTSPDRTTKVWFVAPEMLPQLLPFLSQRCHRYANVIGVDPDHAPLDAVRVWPACSGPEIVGGEVFAGALVRAP